MDYGACCSVYMTCPDPENARFLARLAVEARLAACANVLAGALSVYHWQGSVVEDSETVVFLKTRKDLFAPLTALLTANHPYKVPCIVMLPLEQGFGPYLEWIASETGTEPETTA